MSRPVILLEFNELCPQLMAKFMAEGKLPNFRRLHGEAQVFETVADEVAPFLDPWIQWITVHAGVPYKEHKIRDLGDGYKLAVKNVWDVLSDEGRKVWICGSMNVTHQQPLNGWFIPDPWTTKVPPQPAEVESYFRFVAANVTEYTSGKIPLSRFDQAKFVGFMARHGLSPRTVVDVVKQLASERRGKTHWKRAVILDRMQMDLFKWHWKRARPDFSTFFLNSTAHFQHLYWRNMEPEHFKIKPTEKDQAVYQDAILFGYQKMDGLLGEVLDMAGQDATIAFCTAFSQQPCLTWEDRGGKTPYRPNDFQGFLRAIGITAPAKVSPVMTHQFNIDFETEADAKDAQAKLLALRYGPEEVQAMSADLDGKKVFSGCIVYSAVPKDAVLTVTGGAGRTHAFYELFYHIDLLKSGMHHPDGMFWLRTPERTHAVHPGKVALESLAPTLLGLFGAKIPAHMKGVPLPLDARPAARSTVAA